MAIKYIFWAMVLFLAACAQKPLTAPSAMGVQGGFGRSQAGVSKIKSQQQTIADQNAQAKAYLSRIDNKEILIDAWKKWKATHP